MKDAMQGCLRVAFWAALLCLRAGVVGLEETIVSVRPLVIVAKNFASKEELEGVLRLLDRCHGGDWNQCHETRSRLHAQGNRSDRSSHREHTTRGHDRPIRNSTSFMLDLPGELDASVDAIVRRAHLLARHPVTYSEGVQVATYQAGDYYEFHHDSLMRRATVLLYLNDVPEGDGGETIFPLIRAPGVPDDATPPLPPAVKRRKRKESDFSWSDIKTERIEGMAPYCDSDFYLKIRPEAGTALLFFSYGPDYKADEHAIHGACELRRGRKAILQRWMHFEENVLFEKSTDAVRSARSLWGSERLLPLAQANTTNATELQEARPEDRHARTDTHLFSASEIVQRAANAANKRTQRLRHNLEETPPEL